MESARSAGGAADSLTGPPTGVPPRARLAHAPAWSSRPHCSDLPVLLRDEESNEHSDSATLRYHKLGPDRAYDTRGCQGFDQWSSRTHPIVRSCAAGILLRVHCVSTWRRRCEYTSMRRERQQVDAGFEDTALPTAARRARVLEAVRRSRFASVADLSSQFGVSEVTIRSDLDVLAEEGHIQRVRGEPSTEPPQVLRHLSNRTRTRRPTRSWRSPPRQSS